MVVPAELVGVTELGTLEVVGSTVVVVRMTPGIVRVAVS